MSLNRWQIAKQLVYLLEAATADGSAVLGDAFESATGVENFLASGLTFPIASVQWLEGALNQDLPGKLSEARFRVSVAGTYLSETRSSLWQGSGGTGTGDKSLDVAIKGLIAYLNDGRFIDSTHGFQGYVEDVSPLRLVTAGTDKQYVVGDFDVLVTNARIARFYHPPRLFKATGGGGQVSLTWALPPDRFDRLKVVLRRASGATAPTSATDGTGVTLSGDLATSVTDSGLSAGTYSYAIFGGYDETNSTPTTVDNYSSAVTFTSVTVT